MDKPTASTTIHSNNLIMVDNEFYMKNFKIKELLGDMWDKYERFNFNVISSWDTGTYPSLQLTITGLNWINLPLGEQTKIIISGTGDPIQYKNKQSNVFLKPSSPVVELKFSFMDMATRTIVNNGPFCLLVSINGIEETDVINPNPLNLQTANLYLHSSWGESVNNNGSIITFKNVKIKELLGDMWNKYDKFKIILNAYYNRNTITIQEYQRLIGIRIKGFDFINIWDYSINWTQFPDPYKDIPMLGMTILFQNNYALRRFEGNWGCVFNKPSNSVIDLTLYLYTVQNATTFTDSYNYGTSSFFFTIIGVK